MPSYDNLKHEIPPTAYLPYLQNPDEVRQMTFEIRTILPPMAIARAARRTVAGIDRNVPVAEMRTQEEQIRRSLSMERAFAGLVGSFGLIASLLVAIGLYGVMAYAVTRRTAEIGIRMALGATRGDVQQIVLRDSLVMVVIGITVGVPAALALTRLVRQSLYGIVPNDPASFFAAGALMLTVATLAAWILAWRAARVDPMHCFAARINPLSLHLFSMRAGETGMWEACVKRVFERSPITCCLHALFLGLRGVCRKHKVLAGQK